MATPTTPTTTTEAQRRALYADAFRLQLGRLQRETYGTVHQPRVTRLAQLFEVIEGGVADPAVTVESEIDPDAADTVPSC